MQKLTGKNITLILESDWSELVAEVFDRPYNFQQQAGCRSNDTIWKFTVPESFKDWDLNAVDAAIEQWRNSEPHRNEQIPAVRDGKVVYVEHPRREWPMSDFSLKLWWERENWPEFEDVMCVLARRGLIDPGEYALHIWW
ncbi:hypothetical protein FHT44_004980 [Mycolicibacterium sp. BK634]|uniref:hypothetical protein n=1 Tax=Mycolicibacterium sp. BK634 TaxID=2587099 RepID=UPI00161191B4|nr:hypothetical protein [Mycolicibacterium sp. BK634]MBB3752468.1 hypothetical protein [Mycolicibacterium sp. BK634]